MLSGIQNSSAVQNAYPAASTARPPAPRASSNSQALPQDTVQISARAKAPSRTAGDVDHDGDSH